MDFLPDNSLEETGHWFFRRGLVRQVEKADTHVYLDEADAENRRLLAAYRIPDHKKVKRWTFEGLILGTYALPAEMMGSQCEQLGQRAGALEEWYSRARHRPPVGVGQPGAGAARFVLAERFRLRRAHRYGR